jgi:hypothetical protein
MTKSPKALAVAAALAAAGAASATPSTVVWTPATTYTQTHLVPHLTYDTYVAEKGLLQNTYGLTMGVLPGDKVQGEVGFDLFYPGITADYFQVNGKITVVENLLGKWSPALSVGIANVGFEEDVSDYDLLHATLSKTTPIGALAVGGYYGAGSELLWTGSDGAVARSGFMASWASPEIKVGLPGLEKIVFAADYSSGKNWFGAVGAAASLYFTSNVALLTGPVFFLDSDLYGNNPFYGTDWMWTAQIDVDIPLRK